MGRLDTDRQNALEPKRIEYAVEKIQALGIEIVSRDERKITFLFKNETVTLFPYSGWHTGKSIKDGRGIGLLLKQLQADFRI